MLPGTVQPGSRAPAGAKLLTLEQLAAMERASAGAAKDGGKPHKAKVGVVVLHMMARSCGPQHTREDDVGWRTAVR